MKILATKIESKLNQISGDIIETLERIGFRKLPYASSVYGAVSSDGNDVILYDNDIEQFHIIKNGAMGDSGATVCSYINDKDGWELLLADHSGLQVYSTCSLNEALDYYLE